MHFNFLLFFDILCKPPWTSNIEKWVTKISVNKYIKHFILEVKCIVTAYRSALRLGAKCTLMLSWDREKYCDKGKDPYNLKVLSLRAELITPLVSSLSPTSLWALPAFVRLTQWQLQVREEANLLPTIEKQHARCRDYKTLACSHCLLFHESTGCLWLHKRLGTDRWGLKWMKYSLS